MVFFVSPSLALHFTFGPFWIKSVQFASCVFKVRAQQRSERLLANTLTSSHKNCIALIYFCCCLVVVVSLYCMLLSLFRFQCLKLFVSIWLTQIWCNKFFSNLNPCDPRCLLLILNCNSLLIHNFALNNVDDIYHLKIKTKHTQIYI